MKTAPRASNIQRARLDIIRLYGLWFKIEVYSKQGLWDIGAYPGRRLSSEADAPATGGRIVERLLADTVRRTHVAVPGLGVVSGHSISA